MAPKKAIKKSEEPINEIDNIKTESENDTNVKPKKTKPKVKKEKDEKVLEEKVEEVIEEPIEEPIEVVEKKETKPKKTKAKKSETESSTSENVVAVPESNTVYNGKQVLIVESPNKIKKITDLLDKLKKISNFEKCKFVVTASMGHIREIDKTRVGIDINNNFEPCYLVSDSKIHVVHDLKDAISDAKMVWLAADADREGEAIAWHLKEVLKLKDNDYNRITFNEITEKALKESLIHPRKIDLNMYNSQKARSVIDKLIGYLISPVLDSQFQTFGLSAGRVQSVAVKLVVEREKEINKFESHGYFQIRGVFNPKDSDLKGLQIPADLDRSFPDKESAQEFLDLGNKAEYTIIDIIVNKTKRRPPPPLITSSLQQEASTKLGISPDETMRIAQKLYENGFITYMRTDSVMLSEDAKKEIAAAVKSGFGDNYHQNNVFSNKDGSQEAHEACRPCDFGKTNLMDQGGFTARENKVYELIWKRAMASQMSPAEVEIKTIKIKMDNSECLFISKAEKITFKGFLALYEKEGKTGKPKDKDSKEEKEGEADDEDDQDESINDDSDLYESLSKLEIGDELKYKLLEGSEKFSKPPHGRYTEASLIKELERLKIGRPSTYSSIITKIQDTKRNYVKLMDRKGEKKDVHILQYSKGKFTVKTTSITTGGFTKKLVALETGKSIVEFLDKNFVKIMNYGFTANVEEQLDDIAIGKFIWHEVVKNTYDNFYPQIESIRGNQESGEKGKIKKYLGLDPKSNSDVSIVFTKKGPCIYMEINGEKKYCNITDDEVMDMTIERALDLLKYPIVIKSPSGDEKENIMVCKGKNNYYLKMDKGTVSLTTDSEEPKPMSYQIAKEIFDSTFLTKESKTLRDIDKDILILKGPYGAYISYKGKLNVAIPKKFDYTTITRDECATLINKKKEDKKNGVKPKVFRKFNKKD